MPHFYHGRLGDPAGRGPHPAGRILLAATVAEALALRERFPGALVMGEVDGLPAPGFDLWNSPAQVSQRDLSGCTLIQRTSAGTQGVVQARRADCLMAASFVVAEATARANLTQQPREVTFVITGLTADPRHGAEDRACAEYIAALLRGKDPAPARYLGWLDGFIASHEINTLDEPLRTQFYTDIAYCHAVDRFDFTLDIQRRDGLLVIDGRDYA